MQYIKITQYCVIFYFKEVYKSPFYKIVQFKISLFYKLRITSSAFSRFAAFGEQYNKVKIICFNFCRLIVAANDFYRSNTFVIVFSAKYVELHFIPPAHYSVRCIFLFFLWNAKSLEMVKPILNSLFAHEVVVPAK